MQTADNYYISLADNILSQRLSKEDAKKEYARYIEAFERGNYRLHINSELRLSVEILES